MRRSLPAALLVLPLALGAIAAGDAPSEEAAPELYEACTGTDGKLVVTPDAPYSGNPETPIGALNLAEVEVGTFVLDLAGQEVGTRGILDFTLDWDTPEVGDYDLIVDGTNELSTDKPERNSVSSLAHCAEVDIDVAVFTGTPLDTLTLDVSAR